MNKKEQKQKSKLGAKSKIKLKNYVKINKGDKRFKQVHNEKEVNKAMAELSDGELKEACIEELTQNIKDEEYKKKVEGVLEFFAEHPCPKPEYIQELENDIQEVLDETKGIDDEVDFKERPKAPEPRLVKEGLSDGVGAKEKDKFRDKLLAGVVIGGLLALAFVDIFFNK